MAIAKQIWDSIWGHFSAPHVSTEKLTETFSQAREQLSIPVFWLLGKTQSGKTSLIRALTGNSRAEIGNGIRPCTKTAQVYSFPGEEDCLIRFLDSRGLGEATYDPTEDLQWFENQAHLLVVVMKAMDHAQASVVDAVKAILKRHPQWPVLVVQSCLHEGYPTPAFQHVLPYPFEQNPWPESVPSDLARSLLKQRESLTEAGIRARYVAVDFTLPEDGIAPHNYGLVELWNAIEELLPLGLQGMISEIDSLRSKMRDLRFQTALPHILSYSVAAGAAAGIPVPLVDIPVVIGIQSKMCHAIASIYEQDLNMQRLGEITSAIGLGFLGRLGGREILKLIPTLGSAVSALYSGATTYALGITLCYYFSRVQNGDVPDKEEFQKIYAANFAEGQAKLKEYLDRLRGSSTQ